MIFLKRNLHHFNFESIIFFLLIRCSLVFTLKFINLYFYIFILAYYYIFNILCLIFGFSFLFNFVIRIILFQMRNIMNVILVLLSLYFLVILMIFFISGKRWDLLENSLYFIFSCLFLYFSLLFIVLMQNFIAAFSNFFYIINSINFKFIFSCWFCTIIAFKFIRNFPRFYFFDFMHNFYICNFLFLNFLSALLFFLYFISHSDLIIFTHEISYHFSILIKLLNMPMIL